MVPNLFEICHHPGIKHVYPQNNEDVCEYFSHTCMSPFTNRYISFKFHFNLRAHKSIGETKSEI